MTEWSSKQMKVWMWRRELHPLGNQHSSCHGGVEFHILVSLLPPLIDPLKSLTQKQTFALSSCFFPPKSFYLHLSDCQHFCFRHSQMIWSFNLLKGLQQAVLHINHTELLLHQDLTSLSKLHMPQQKTYTPAPTHTYVSESEAPVYRKVAAYHIYCSFLWAVLGSSIKSHLHFVCLGANVLLFHEGAWCDNAAVLLWEQMRYYWGSENAKGTNWTVRQMHRLRNCPED